MSHIVARGGGGLSDDPGDLALNAYTLELSGVRKPRVCFLPTASGDERDNIIRFYETFCRLDCRPTHLTLFRRTVADLGALLAAQEVIWVGGGNTRNMLALWREWAIDQHLREAAARGAVLAGSSAGAICWFESGLTDSIPGRITAMPALGLLPGSFCPHYDSEPLRRPRYYELLAAGAIEPGLACDDGAAVHFIDGRLHEVLAWKPAARMYRLSLVDGQVDEQAVDGRLVA